MKLFKKFFHFTAFLATTFLFLVIQTSCYKDSKEAIYSTRLCDTTNITWNKEIQSIVNTSCATTGCHNASSASGGYALNDFAGVKKCIENKKFLIVIENGSMPKSAPLSNCSINKIRRWINQGALEN